MVKTKTYRLYLFEGKQVSLAQIVARLHPDATENERNKYYTRYYKRLQNGATIEQAIHAGANPLTKNRMRTLELPVSPSPAAKPAAAETEVELPVALTEQEAKEEEYQRALSYCRNVQVTFRKYQGRSLAYVLETEPSYIEWMRKRLVENADNDGLKVLYAINKLYNDYPVAQEKIRSATQAYFDQLNAARTVVATTSLGDNPKLQGLAILPEVGVAHVTATPVDYTAFTFEQVQALQAEQLAEDQALRAEQSAMDKRRPAIISRLQELHFSQQQLAKRLEELRPPAPEVTDHAVVRYLERVAGLNMEELKRQIVGFEDNGWLFDYQASGAANGRYLVSDTHRVHVENNTVVTVLPR